MGGRAQLLIPHPSALIPALGLEAANPAAQNAALIKRLSVVHIMRCVLASIIVMVPACTLLAGCFGIAHSIVTVPKLDIVVASPVSLQAPRTSVEIIRPEFWAESQVFLAIVKDSLSSNDCACNVRAVPLSGPVGGEVSFPPEKRYVGFPIFIIPWGPPGESSRNRVIFLRTNPASDLYRITVVRRYVKVERCDMRLARTELPVALQGNRPSPPSPQWNSWYEAESVFYRSIQWVEADNVRVLRLDRNDERDFLSFQVHVRDGN
jgi:hypothetical protein